MGLWPARVLTINAASVRRATWLRVLLHGTGRHLTHGIHGARSTAYYYHYYYYCYEYQYDYYCYCYCY